MHESLPLGDAYLPDPAPADPFTHDYSSRIKPTPKASNRQLTPKSDHSEESIWYQDLVIAKNPLYKAFAKVAKPGVPRLLVVLLVLQHINTVDLRCFPW